MKPTRNPFLRNALAASLAITFSTSSAFAAAVTQYWSGSGTWGTSANWSAAGVSGGPYTTAWNNATADIAVFEGTAGTVNISTGRNVSTLTFNTTGYSLTGSAVTLTGPAGISVNLAANVSASIGNGIIFTTTSTNTTFNLVGLNQTTNTLDLSGTIKNTTNNNSGIRGITVNVKTGGLIQSASSTFLGADSSGNNALGATLVVDGGTYSMTNANGNSNLVLGQAGTNASTLTIKNGGTFTFTNAANTGGIRFGSGSSAATTQLTGTVNLDGGTLETSRIFFPSTAYTGTATYNATVNFNGGVLKALATNNTDFLTLTNGGVGATAQAVVKSGGATIDTNSFSVTIGQALLHDSTLGATADGGLTKKSAGTLTLSGANTYTGATTITGGKLSIGSTGTINSTSGVTIGTVSTAATTEFNYNSSTALSKSVSFAGTGGILSGSGTITPAVTVSSGNFLSPGNSIGTLTFGTGLTITGTYNAQLGTAGSTPVTGVSDLAAVTGDLTLTGGTLALSDNGGANSNGSAGAGAYRLITFSGSRTGTFSTVTNPLSSTLHEVVVYNGTSNGTVDLNLYRLAAATAPGTSKALGNVRVGTALTGSDSITNSATSDGFSETLKATVSSNGTGFAGVAAGSSGTVNYSLATSTAGAQSGTASVVLKSTANATNDNNTYGDTTLSTTSVLLSGAAYDYASPSYTNTLALGNVRIGASLNRSITNSVISNASYQDSLDVVATNGGNTNLTVGNPGNITAGNSGNVSYTANAAGSLAATSSLGFTSNANGIGGLSNTALTSGSISITGAAYDYAAAKYTGGAVALGNYRVGAIPTAQNVAFGNQTVTNASFQDTLDVSATTSNSQVGASGFTGLAASTGGATTNNLTLTPDTSVAGSLASTVSLTLTSNANGVTGLSNGTASTVGSPAAITTTGAVYNPASADTIADVSVGKTRVGGTFSGTAALSISNTAPSGSYTEGLNATVGSTTGGASGSGLVSNLAPGSPATSILVGLAGANTSTSGLKTGSVTIDLASSGTNSSLSNLGLASQTVGVSGLVYDYADAVFSKSAGTGTFGGSGSSYSLNFGTGLALNTTYTATIQLANYLLSSYQDNLGGSYGSLPTSEFASGVENTSIASLVAGTANTFTITFNTGSTGNFSDTLTFTGASQQSGLSDATLGAFTINLTANAVPEPDVSTLIGGIGMLLLLRRRR